MSPPAATWVVFGGLKQLSVCVFTSGFRFSVHDKTSHVWVTAQFRVASMFCLQTGFASRSLRSERCWKSVWLAISRPLQADGVGKKVGRPRCRRDEDKGKHWCSFATQQQVLGFQGSVPVVRADKNGAPPPEIESQHSQLLGSRKTGKQVATEATAEDQKSSKEGKKKQQRGQSTQGRGKNSMHR